jgi:hypothetical protein
LESLPDFAQKGMDLNSWLNLRTYLRMQIAKVLTDDSEMSASMSTGSAISFTPGKRLMTGGRIITSVVHIHRGSTRLRLNLQRAGETGNMKKNQPTLQTEGCI